MATNDFIERRPRHRAGRAVRERKERRAEREKYEHEQAHERGPLPLALTESFGKTAWGGASFRDLRNVLRHATGKDPYSGYYILETFHGMKMLNDERLRAEIDSVINMETMRLLTLILAIVDEPAKYADLRFDGRYLLTSMSAHGHLLTDPVRGATDWQSNGCVIYLPREMEFPDLPAAPPAPSDSDSTMIMIPWVFIYRGVKAGEAVRREIMGVHARVKSVLKSMGVSWAVECCDKRTVAAAEKNATIMANWRAALERHNFMTDVPLLTCKSIWVEPEHHYMFELALVKAGSTAAGAV